MTTSRRSAAKPYVLWGIMACLAVLLVATPFIYPFRYVAPAFVMTVPLMWVAFIVVVARLSGWHDLARLYASRQPFAGSRIRCHYAEFRWGAFFKSGTLTAGADEHGLHLAAPFMFVMTHAPLLIPWRAIRVEEGLQPRPWRKWEGVRTTFRFRNLPDVSIKLSAEVADQLKAAAGSAWPHESDDREDRV